MDMIPGGLCKVEPNHNDTALGPVKDQRLGKELQDVA